MAQQHRQGKLFALLLRRAAWWSQVTHEPGYDSQQGLSQCPALHMQPYLSNASFTRTWHLSDDAALHSACGCHSFLLEDLCYECLP